MNTYKQLINNQDNFTKISEINYTEILRYNASPPFVTIGIPTFNRAPLLKQAIDSALNQKTNIKFEVLIVDNNPNRNDETEQIMLTLSNHKNISYYKNNKNIGLVGNWNRIYELAKGTWVVMLHDDDLLFNDYIEIMFSKVIPKLKEENIAIQPTWVKQGGENIAIHKISRNKHTMKALKIAENDFYWGNLVGAPIGFCIKKDIMIKFGGFSYDNYPNIDRLFFLRYSIKFPLYRLYGYPLAIYRICENSCCHIETLRQSIRNHKSLISILLSTQSKHKRIFITLYLQYTSNEMLKSWLSAYKITNINILKEMQLLELKPLPILHKLISKVIGKILYLNRGLRKRKII